MGEPPTTRFGRETHLERLRPGVFAGQFDTGWWGNRGPHGGFLAAVMLTALMQAPQESDRRPVFLTVHYLEPPATGPFTVTSSIERAGRSVTTVTARLEQDGRSMCLGAASFSSRTARVEYEEEPPPRVPPPEPCPEISFSSLSESWEDLAVARRFEWRLAFGPPLSAGGTANTGG